jgi:hypothetical protein
MHLDAEITGQLDRVAFVRNAVEGNDELRGSLPIFDDYHSKRKHPVERTPKGYRSLLSDPVRLGTMSGADPATRNN